MNRVMLLISGEFEDHELTAMMMLLRSIDRRNPSRAIDVALHDLDGTTTHEAEKMLRKILPQVPGRETKFTIHRRQ